VTDILQAMIPTL